MGLPPLRTSNVSSFTESDRKNMRSISQKLSMVGTVAVNNDSAPIRCGPYEVALIDEILMTAQLPDSGSNVTCTIHINGATAGELGAPATVTAQPLRFNFPGIVDATVGFRRSDRLHLFPRGNLVVRPSSTLWVQASVANTVGCHIKFRRKGLLDAIRDGDIRADGTMPNAASTNSVTTGGTNAATSKNIAYCGTVMLSGGVADAGGDTTHLVDAALVQGTNYWNGKKVRFTSGANNGLIRVVTAFDAGTDTITFSPAVGAGVGAGDTYEILDVDEAIEILGFYLTGHSWNAAADDIRLGFWDGAAGSFAANGAMVFRGWAQGVSNIYQPRVLVDDTRGCIQGALGSDLYIQASTNLAGATPPADYVVMYRKVRRTEVASTTGTIGATPTVRKKWWYYTQAAAGLTPNPFFAATVTGDDTVMVKVHGHAWSATNSDGGASIIGLTIGAVGNPLGEYTVVSGDGDGATVSNSAYRVGMNIAVRKDTEPGFLAFDAVAAMANRAQLAWGTFGAGADTSIRDSDIQ